MTQQLSDEELNSIDVDSLLDEYNSLSLADENSFDDLLNPQQVGEDSLDSLLNEYKELDEITTGGIETPKIEEAPTETDFVDSALRGIKMAVMPQFIDDEEWKKQNTTAGAVTEGVTNLVTAVAASMAAGAAVGSVVPIAGTTAGIVGGLIYGIYSGFAYEAGRSRAEGQEYNVARGALNAALEANPLINKGSKLVNALRVVAQIKGSVEVEKSYGTTDEDVLRLAAIGGGLSMVGPVFSAFKPTAKQVAELGDMIGDPKYKIHERSFEIFDELKEKFIPDQDEMFMNYLTKKVSKGTEVNKEDLSRSFRENWDKLGQEAQDDFIDSYLFSRSQMRATTEVAKEAYNKLGDNVKDTFVHGFGYFEDPKFVARKVDNRLGTTIESTLDEISFAENAVANFNAPYLKMLKESVEKLDDAKVSREQIGRYLAGKADVPDEHVDLVKSFRDIFDDYYKAVSNHKKADIGYLDNYLPMQELPPPDLNIALHRGVLKFESVAETLKTGETLTTLQRRLKKIRKGEITSDTYSPEDAAKLSKELMQLKLFSRNHLGKQVKTFNNLRVAADSVLKAKGKAKQGYDLNMLYSRGKEMPEEFRDYDVVNAMLGYLNSNTKSLFITKPLAQLQNDINTLSALKLNGSANYFNKYLGNMSGHESGFKAALQSAIYKHEASWKKVLSDDSSTAAQKLSAKTKQGVVDMASWMGNIVYPNLLGFKFDATLRNYSQSLFTTAPEVGGTYGLNLVKRGWADLIKRPDGNIEEFLKQKSLVSGAEVLKEGRELLDDQIIRNPALRKYAKGVDKINDMLMYFYQKSDETNRYITYKAGQHWAKDIMEGNKEAIKRFQKIPPGYMAKIKAIKAEGDLEALGDSLGKYLDSTTQFRYGKTQMNEFGRDFGRLFSMFTKWPVMTVSENVYAFQQLLQGNGGKDLKKVLIKYWTPLITLQLAQEVRESTDNDKGLNAFILGQDLRSYAPISSAFGFRPIGGPLLDMGTKSIDQMAKLAKREQSWEDFFSNIGGDLKKYTPAPVSVIREVERFQKSFDETKRRKNLDGGVLDNLFNLD